MVRGSELYLVCVLDLDVYKTVGDFPSKAQVMRVNAPPLLEIEKSQLDTIWQIIQTPE